ncbi:hypothetical protein CVS40_6361 [Lucilia cuprina]|nr:hypothetical protein CVS40_6361 [Lucilia cuprina]
MRVIAIYLLTRSKYIEAKGYNYQFRNVLIWRRKSVKFFLQKNWNIIILGKEVNFTTRYLI